MNLTDTHSHIYLPEFDNDRDEVVARALAAGIAKMIMPNIDRKSFPEMMKAADRYPGICIPMIGLHPTSVGKEYQEELDFVIREAESKKYVAIGEVGIDLYWDKTHIEEQKKAFRQQVELAIRLDLPVVIHARESFEVIFSILTDYRQSGIRGVFHAFTGSADDLRMAISMGFMIGVGGIVTFKNSGLAGVLTGAGIENIVLETDSPYLAPAPHRGRRNESSYLTLINQKVASLFGLSPDEAARVTTENSGRIFDRIR
jgi:TatD DNase family protein